MTRDPYRYFRVEARELLDQLGKGILELDKGACAPELIALVLRLAHTLKGAARVVKQREIADGAHAIEDALSPFREGGKPVSRDGIGASLKALDEITGRLSVLAPPSEGERAPDAQPRDSARGLAASPGEPLEAVRANVDEVDALLAGLTEAGVQLAVLYQGVAPLERARRLALSLEERFGARRNQLPGDSSTKPGPLAAELRTLIESLERDLKSGVEQVDRELTQAREVAERLRLLPASFMFLALQRAARDAAQAMGKRIAFVTSGGDVRLDAQVFGAVQSALVQAVRNAVVHGIESEAERRAAGKSAEGRVVLEVSRRGHRAVFVCRDDGRGVDLDAVRSAMERKGLNSAESARLSSEELLQALLGGGISTLGTVTQLAGRGIGLDVIREASNRLRGDVSIRTERGLGTTLQISVPVSLAAVEALIVEAGGGSAAIPLDAVKRTLRMSSGDLAQSANGTSILFEGQVIPFAPLERALRRAVSSHHDARTWSAVIIEGANALAAVGIDRMRGTQSLVLRPLPELTPADPIVAGASLDAEGHPQLVLDPDALVEHVRRAGSMPARTASPRAPILVIDDSLTTRMLEQSILESAGYEVDLAISAEAALEQAHKRPYALFLVDVEMPGMDGFTFIERIRADSVLREIPAILVTSRASNEDRERGRRVGARAYIVKGEFDQTEFLDQIRRLVGWQ
jgi:two-component system, chemotaxis family, sensor kinase CheA